MVRCQIHSYDETDDGENTFINIYALNEFDKNTFKSPELSMYHHFRKELYNNHLKITKWGAQCYLAGVDNVKIGFVTRSNVKNNTAHNIAGFSDIKLSELLAVTNFNTKIAWGAFKQIIEIIRDQPDGTFILMKTLAGAKPIVKLLRLPSTTTLEAEEEEEI